MVFARLNSVSNGSWVKRYTRGINRHRAGVFAGILSVWFFAGAAAAEERAPAGTSSEEYNSQIRPLLKQYCYGCHSAEKHKGSLDLERFETLGQMRRDLKPWVTMTELLEAGEMPPEGKRQPSAEEHQRLLSWVHNFLNAEAIARAGDPGFVPLRRLSNAEYNYTIRDLTGVDLQPAREFPADGAAGEGFTNAAEALADMSPTLLDKYLAASKEIASHAVLLPDGFRFSQTRTRRDWTNESVARLRAFYADQSADGRLPLTPYLQATIRYRKSIASGEITPEAVAAKEKLSPKYLGILWHALNDKNAPFPLDQIRLHWETADEKEVPALVARITAWQTPLWNFGPIGSYRKTVRQVPNDPPAAPSQTLKLKIKPAAGQRDVVIYLVARDIIAGSGSGHVIWRRPRFEGGNKPPLLLRNYAEFGPAFGIAEPSNESLQAPSYGLPKERFGPNDWAKDLDDASLGASGDEAVEIRLPAGLFKDHEFVVEGEFDSAGGENRIVQLQVQTTPPAKGAAEWDGKSSLITKPDGPAFKHFLGGLAAFRQLFPPFICYPRVIPDDEVVCLKQYHREDDELIRLFLNDEQKRRIDHLWDEHRFISQWYINENKYLPLFIGFVTQDQPKELLAYFEAMREPFRKRAEASEEELRAAVPSQLEALEHFAGRAYRRPMLEGEKTQLHELYQALRAKGETEENAIRGVLARVLIAPAFLFRLEQPPGGKQAGPVNDWELATRLSYFLWSTLPDDELRAAAASGQLHDPAVMEQQARRMLKDERVRAMAIEFGTQLIHVRGFDEFKEKNEKLFPTFNESLRGSIYEESILFFKDLFQNDERVTDLIDADYTYLNDALAVHYAIAGVSGKEFRRVDGVKKFGRGGILGLASVQSKQAGASRTSPVLRGNWVVETLLGEKLPRPPADVPKLPDDEGAEGLTTRQMVMKHTSVASCAVCHVRIDPIGFSFERYDAIGRLREKEASGLPIDCKATMKDGTELNGIDGLRSYLLTKKKEVVVRLFCRRLLGYALGRAVTLSDQSTLDEMVAALNKNDGHMSAAVLAIVQSPQFRSIRGSAYSEDE